MLGPDSRLLLVLLLILSAAALFGVIRLRLVALKVACGALSIAMAMVAGIVAVNNFYGYYTTWGQLWADFHGGTGGLGTISAASRQPVGSGRFGWIDLSGRQSGYDRRALLYLPPQYGEPQYAHVRFPVVELFHGSPGSPLAWDTLLRIDQVANQLIESRAIGPMILVMPSIDGPGRDYQDCVNGPGVSDETYLLNDVRADLEAKYRVSLDGYQWGASGYSSGGFCAANLALRHPTWFGAAAVMNGYYRAADGPAGAALGGNQALEAANSPLFLAEKENAGGPLPAFWVAAGTTDKTDYGPATTFATALDHYEQVPFIKLNAGDTANAWEASVPVALTWLWQQLAPPDLRVLFPVHSPTPVGGSLHVQPVKKKPVSHLLKPTTPASKQAAPTQAATK
jgi:hypothetical protein